MLGLAWQPITHFRLSFGTADSLQALIQHLQTDLAISSDAPIADIIAGITARSGISDQCFPLARYVPTRFLKPWFSETLCELHDRFHDTKIIDLSAKSQDTNCPSPYFFRGRGKNRTIVMNPGWRDFLHFHSALVLGFVHFHLIRFLQARNPNVPGIIEKLAVPGKRDLSAATKFWKEISTRFPLRCIYSGERLHSDLVIDHFLPWSFVAHDQLWNLIPTTGVVNSRKGDRIPSLRCYLRPAAYLHWSALGSVQSDKIPEDYCVALQLDSDSIRNLIRTHRREEFCLRYEAIMRPQAQIAENLGFQPAWAL
jgi:hypothetical protein